MRRLLPAFAVIALVAIGSLWSFQRGGHDFAVFYEAWKLVLQGHGAEIYARSPDRFLYAPGFAWVLSPLALLPKPLALGFWDLAKSAVVFLLIRALAVEIVDQTAQSFHPVSRELASAAAAGGFVLIARPLLIDFQYGQVNTFILGVTVWAVLKYLSRKTSSSQVALAWFWLGIAAVSKLFALPLLLLPWFRPRKGLTTAARAASGLGVALAAAIPVLSLGFSGTVRLICAWREALIAKGLPFESHNQSFIALLDHYFTTTPTHIIALGWHWVVLGKPLLSMTKISELSLAWSFLFVGFLVAWIAVARTSDTIRWISVAVALLFVPSYLIWKPYFVLSYPLAVLILWRYRRSKPWVIALGFVAMNLTGFNFLGGYWAGRIEAASVFLLVHLAYLACVLWAKPDSQDRSLASGVLGS